MSRSSTCPASRCRAKAPAWSLVSDSVLTADGEAAFPDYQAGTAFDPLKVALELDQCSPAGGYAGGDDISPAPTPAWVIAGAVLGPLALIAAIVSAILLATRRRRARA